MNLRKAALINSLVGCVSLLVPFGNLARQLGGSKWWLVLAAIFSSLMPLFCFALYRYEGELRISERNRALALMAAMGIGVLTLASVPSWFKSLAIGAGGSVLTPGRALGTLETIAWLMGVLSNIAYMWLLTTLSRRSDDEHSEAFPISRSLRVMTNVTVLGWGIWVAFNITRLLLTPYTYSLLRNYAFQMGRTPPGFGVLVADAAQTLLSQSCIFTLPYIVWSSSRQVLTQSPTPGSR